VRRCRMVVCGAIAARAVGRGTQCGSKMTHAKPRPTFKVDFSERNDDHLDFAFRHCRIMERDGARLVRTFTGKVPRSQSTRKRVRQDIARWCEIHLRRLPEDGGAVIVDLDYIWKPV
jgi:hypothetical protein